MGIYSEYAKKLWDNGFVSTPVEGKRPFLKDWQIWSDDIDKQREKINHQIKTYPDAGIGYVLGKVNNSIGFDIDISNKEMFEEFLTHVNRSSIIKTGKKGETNFYEYIGQLAQKSIQYVNPNDPEDKIGLELLGDGNQTVIPPTIHPQIKSPYIWVRGSLYDIKRHELDTPSFTNSDFDRLCGIFYELCKKYGYVVFRKESKNDSVISTGGRNDVLVQYVMELNDSNMPIRKIVKNVLAKDKELYKSPLFEDETEGISGSTPEERAASFVGNVTKSFINKDIKKKLNKKESIKSQSQADDTGKRSTKYTDFKLFFDKKLDGSKLEKLTKELVYKDDKKWQPVFSRLPSIKSEAHEFGLNRTYVEDHLSKYIESMTPELLIDFPKWDGFSRLEKIFNCIAFDKEGLGPSVSFDLLKGWCANIFKRIEDPMNQNQILVLRGGQGIGKDTFVNKVFGRSFGSYFVNMEPNEHNKENFMIIYGKLIANISEFDQTNKMTLGALKNLITTNSQRFRMPYERSARDYDFHTSFIASSNFESILRDTTGNRRYILFDIAAIDFEYDPFLQPEQIRAEMHQLFLDNYTPSQKSTDALKKLIEYETPDTFEDEIVERVRNKISELEIKSFGRKIRYEEIEHAVLDLSRSYGVKVWRIQNIIKNAGLRKRTDGKVHYVSEP